jgi:4-hydroxy-L-threonine phosphate dehydrogenase PdxA
VTQSAIALTIGDPNGIGPEIAVKAAAKLAREGGPAVVLVATNLSSGSMQTSAQKT